MNALHLERLQGHWAGHPLADWLEQLQPALEVRYAAGHGDLERWQAALQQLPQLQAQSYELSDPVRISGPVTPGEQTQLESALRMLMPWRKGPFELFGIPIDTEWRSDWKWQRLQPHLNLHGEIILDVGCGNGYHLWRMLEAGAHSVLGVDPGWLFLHQFQAVRHYLPELPAWLLPLTLEDLPAQGHFDRVFSMGVLYHRRSPLDHLLELKNQLRSGGELVLETLVIPGDATQVLVPEDRYAQMRNVWFLPSVAALELWLRRAGFDEVRCLDVTPTTILEQRQTDWMRFQSLADFLDPQDPSRTLEGYPAPVRAALVARKP